MTRYVNGYPVIRCEGNGQGVCARCRALKGQPIHWMTWLYESEGFDGLLCNDCVNELIKNYEEDDKE